MLSHMGAVAQNGSETPISCPWIEAFSSTHIVRRKCNGHGHNGVHNQATIYVYGIQPGVGAQLLRDPEQGVSSSAYGYHGHHERSAPPAGLEVDPA